MLNNRLLILCFLLSTSAIHSFGQDKDTSAVSETKKYTLMLYVSGGAGYFPSNKGAPSYLQPQLNRVNPVYTVRVMWKPDHHVKAGLETGYVTFYSYKLSDSIGNKGKISLNATPLLLEFSAAIYKRFNIFAGPGVYWLHTNLDYKGKVTSTKVTMGWMAAAEYIHPITKNIGIGAEAKWLYAAETLRGSFGVQLQLVWKFLKW